MEHAKVDLAVHIYERATTPRRLNSQHNVIGHENAYGELEVTKANARAKGRAGTINSRAIGWDERGYACNVGDSEATHAAGTKDRAVDVTKSVKTLRRFWVQTEVDAMERRQITRLENDALKRRPQVELVR